MQRLSNLTDSVQVRCRLNKGTKNIVRILKGGSKTFKSKSKSPFTRAKERRRWTGIEFSACAWRIQVPGNYRELNSKHPGNSQNRSHTANDRAEVNVSQDKLFFFTDDTIHNDFS